MAPIPDLASRRSDFPALRQFTWFDNGVVSLTPQPVADEYSRSLEEIVRRGPPHVTFPEEEYPRRRASHERIATFLGARTEDIALMRGVGDAYQTVLRGIEWQRDDELIISSDEEAALLLPSLHLRDEKGVRLIRLPVEQERTDLVRDLTTKLTRRTRLVAFSHVTTNLGYRLPVRELCTTARESGVLSFVDVAHSAGLLPVHMEELGCDLAGALSYKWMYGPYAAGALWARRDCVDRIALRFAGNRSEAFLDEEHLRYGVKRSAERFEYGPWPWPLVHAWATAVDYVDSLGPAAIWSHTYGLTTRLKKGLTAIAGVKVLTPWEEAASAGLVTFTIEGIAGQAASRILRAEHNVRIKHVPTLPNGLRASVAFFNLEDEVDDLVQCVATLAGHSRR